MPGILSIRYIIPNHLCVSDLESIIFITKENTSFLTQRKISKAYLGYESWIGFIDKDVDDV